MKRTRIIKDTEPQVSLTPPKTMDAYLNFSNFSPANIIPVYVEKINKNGWIDWGRNNLYPTYLINLTNRSPLHNAIVHMKASMLGRNGFINVNWNRETIKFIKNLANKDDLEQILAKIALDYVIFGGFCLNIRWSKNRSRIAEINYVSPDSVRIAAPSDEDDPNDVQAYYVCEDWKNWRKFPPVKFPGYSTINKKEASQILYVTEHRSSNNWYPVPEYLPGINMIETDYMINEFHKHTLDNQFSPSFHIHFPFEPQSIEQRNQVAGRMFNDFKGVKKAGNIIMSFGEAGKTAPVITPIQMNDNNDRLLSLKTTILDGIVSAHQLTSKKLVSIDNGGGVEVGNSENELIKALSTFQAQYIAPKQQDIQKELNKLARQNGVPDKLIIQTYDTNLTPDIPMTEMLALLGNALISARQKVEILITKGYSRDEALLLVNKDVEVKPQTDIPEIKTPDQNNNTI